MNELAGKAIQILLASLVTSGKEGIGRVWPSFASYRLNEDRTFADVIRHSLLFIGIPDRKCTIVTSVTNTVFISGYMPDVSGKMPGIPAKKGPADSAGSRPETPASFC